MAPIQFPTGTDPYFQSPANSSAGISGMGFDPNGNNELTTMLQRGGHYLYPTMGADLSYLQNYLDPQRLSALTGYVNQQLDPANVQAGIGQFNNQAQQQGVTGGALSANMLAGMGYGSGAQAGAIAGSLGNAQRMMGANYQQQMSPQMSLQRLMSGLSAINQGSQSPALSMMQSMWNPVEQGHLVNQSELGSGSAAQGIFGALGSLAGMGAFGSGGGFAGLGGSLGGGSSFGLGSTGPTSYGLSGTF